MRITNYRCESRLPRHTHINMADVDKQEDLPKATSVAMLKPEPDKFVSTCARER